MNPRKPNRLFALPLELFEEVASYLDYHSLKSLAFTNVLAQRSLIRKRHLLPALLAIELHDDDEAKLMQSKNFLPCYACLRVLPAASAFNSGFDVDIELAGFKGDFACTRMCKECVDQAGGILVRAPKFKRVRRARIALLERRGWVVAGRLTVYQAWRKRQSEMEWEIRRLQKERPLSCLVQ